MASSKSQVAGSATKKPTKEKIKVADLKGKKGGALPTTTGEGGGGVTLFEL